MKHFLASVLSLSALMAGSAMAAPQTAPVASSQRHVIATPGQAPAAAPQAVQPQRQPPCQAAGERPMLEQRHHQQHHAGPGHEGQHRRHFSGPRHADGPRGAMQRGERIRLGAPLAENRQGVVVSEPGKHGLRKAPRGQEWRKLGQRYVRVTSGSNVVNEIVINGL